MAFLDETGLAELWELIQAEDEEVLSACGKVAYGTFTGTNTVGASNPTVMTFDFEPKLVIIVRKKTNGSYGPGFYYGGSVSFSADFAVFPALLCNKCSFCIQHCCA
jgi:hypothetical protein